MDDEARLRALIREELERLLDSRQLVLRRGSSLSDREREQRRVAAQASAAKRKQRPVERPVETKKPKKSAPKKRPVPTGGNGADGEVIHSLPTGVVDSAGRATITDTPVNRCWLAYAAAYKLRYGVFPVRNAKVNGQLGQLVQRLGHDEAPLVAEFYVRDDEKFLVQREHALDLLVGQCERFRTRWVTGRKAGEPPPRPWWETWSGLTEQARQLGIEEGSFDDPQRFRHAVLTAAKAWGSLPPDAAAALGLDVGPDR